MFKKKILFLTPYYKGARGNVTTTKRICSAYEREGSEVTVFPYAEGKT